MAQFLKTNNNLMISTKLIKLKNLLKTSSKNQEFPVLFNQKNNTKTNTLTLGKNPVSVSLLVNKGDCSSYKENVSKNFSLYVSIIDKPINLLFSIDQFVFELSKKSYQQKKTGEFYQQLKERKKLSIFYGDLTQRQLYNLLNKTKKNKGDLSSLVFLSNKKTGGLKNVFSLLERRLDVVLYRSGITKTVAQARQLIKHKKVQVNHNVINIPSFLLNPGDIVSLTSKTEIFLGKFLLNTITAKSKKRYPVIFIDFLKKLRKYKKYSNSISLTKTKFQLVFQKIQYKWVCMFLSQLLCTKIKVRCIFNLKKKFWVNDLIHSINQQFDKKDYVSQQKLLTKLKWKTSSCVFLEHKKTTHKINNLRRTANKFFSTDKKNTKDSIDTSFGSLQKKPQFRGRILIQRDASVFESYRISENTKNNWKSFSKTQNSYISDDFYSLEKKALYTSNNKKAVTTPLSNSLSYFSNKALEFSIEEREKGQKQNNFQNKNLLWDNKTNSKKNLAIYRICFLFFLKYLKNDKQFRYFLTVNYKKFLTNKFFHKKNLFVKKNLSFRTIKPIHLEISYSLLNVIYLYPPQRVNFPFYIDFDLIQRSLR